MTTPIVSVVLGTCNRVHFLRRSVASIHTACGNLAYEIIIVDAGSTDGTKEYLLQLANNSKNVRVIQQGERLGAVAAFNAGFKAARGEFVAATNDDCEYIGAPLMHAVTQLRADKLTGQVAIPFLACGGMRDITQLPDEVRGIPKVQLVALPGYGTVVYANFSVIRRELGDELGWWGSYQHYAGDTELSARVWERRLSVKRLNTPGHYLVHYELEDATRVPNVETAIFTTRWRARSQ